MLYQEGYKAKTVLTQGMEDATSIISSLSLPCLQHEFSCHQQSCLVTYVASLLDSSFSEHEGPPPPEWEASVGTGVLVAINASLPVIAEKAALLQAAGVPDPDTAIITGEAPSSSEEPGTSTGGGNSPGSQDLHRGSGTTISLDHSSFCILWICLLTASWPMTWTQYLKQRWGMTPEVALRGSSMKFALHPLMFRTWARIPWWG